MKKKYESTKICRDKYNKENSTIQINKSLIEKLKIHMKGSSTLKKFIEIAIVEKINRENQK